MRRYTGSVINTAGQPQAAVSVYVVASGTQTLASLFNAAGAPLTNPLTTDGNGQYFFYVTSGVYDIQDTNRNPLMLAVQIFDFQNPAEWIGVWKFPASGFNIGLGLLSNSTPANILGGTPNPGTPLTLLSAGAFVVAQTSAIYGVSGQTADYFSVFVQAGNAIPKFRLDSTGKLWWSPGNDVGSLDVNLYRGLTGGVLPSVVSDMPMGAQHFASLSGTPTFSLMAGAGSGGSLSCTIIGNDSGGVILLTTGNAPAANSPLVDILFNAPYFPKPNVVLWPANQLAMQRMMQNTAGVYVDYTVTTVSQFEITVNGTLNANSTFAWQYLIIG
jgi:hypothetical protein